MQAPDVVVEIAQLKDFHAARGTEPNEIPIIPVQSILVQEMIGITSGHLPISKETHHPDENGMKGKEFETEKEVEVQDKIIVKVDGMIRLEPQEI